MKEASVYLLLDSEGSVRYVGITTQPLRRRYNQHLEATRLRRRTHVAAWLSSEVAQGRRPRMALVACGLTVAEAQRREREIIQRLRRNGRRLTNITDGGEGTHGWTPDHAFRAALSRAHKGRPKSAEHRAKLRAHLLQLNAKKKGVPRGPQTPEHIRLRIERMKQTLAERRRQQHGQAN